MNEYNALFLQGKGSSVSAKIVKYPSMIIGFIILLDLSYT